MVLGAMRRVRALANQIAQLTKQGKGNAEMIKKQGKENAELIKKLSGGPQQGTAFKAKYWTCGSCKDERCFENKLECHKCGAARWPQPPGLPAAGQAADIQMEVREPVKVVATLEEQISGLEAWVKHLRAANDKERSKVHLEVAEAELRELKDQQKRARPLPARFQAAANRPAAGRCRPQRRPSWKQPRPGSWRQRRSWRRPTASCWKPTRRRPWPGSRRGRAPPTTR